MACPPRPARKRGRGGLAAADPHGPIPDAVPASPPSRTPEGRKPARTRGGCLPPGHDRKGPPKDTGGGSARGAGSQEPAKGREPGGSGLGTGPQTGGVATDSQHRDCRLPQLHALYAEHQQGILRGIPHPAVPGMLRPQMRTPRRAVREPPVQGEVWSDRTGEGRGGDHDEEDPTDAATSRQEAAGEAGGRRGRRGGVDARGEKG